VEQRVEALRHFQRALAARYGTTLVHEAGLHPWETMLDAYLRLEDADELTARFCLDVMLDPDLPLDEQLEAAAEMRARFTGPLVRAAGVKLFVDGVIETHTACLAEPYADRPDFSGVPIWEPGRLVEASVAAAAAGFQLHYHAIGDAAVSLAVDAIAVARGGGRGEARQGLPDATPVRDIITHVQLVDPADYTRMAALGVVAAVQPYWFTRDPDYYQALRRLVGERADHQYPMRSFLRAGVAVAGASDYPVSPPPDPLLAIQRGVLRRDPTAAVENAELWLEEAVDVETMIELFTIAGARANFLEHETGSLEVGKSADLVVLRESLLDLPPERIHEAAVELTLFRGLPVFAAGSYAGLEG
jgi:predicted amidohydrolase YtcJ